MTCTDGNLIVKLSKTSLFALQHLSTAKSKYYEDLCAELQLLLSRLVAASVADGRWYGVTWYWSACLSGFQIINVV